MNPTSSGLKLVISQLCENSRNAIHFNRCFGSSTNGVLRSLLEFSSGPSVTRNKVDVQNEGNSQKHQVIFTSQPKRGQSLMLVSLDISKPNQFLNSKHCPEIFPASFNTIL